MVVLIYRYVDIVCFADSDIIIDSYFFAYELIDFVITNVCIFLFLNMFFQVFKDDILELPSSLIENVYDIPGILCDS